jgi:hypothetical protein
MLAQHVVREIRQLLALQRLSQRQIAVRLGVSRNTVGAIAAGRRRDRPPPDSPDDRLFCGPYVRCPGCGGKVQMPCLACRLRAMRPSR